jgi:Fibrinogen beta and gamma chains, C-terminal globular domain
LKFNPNSSKVDCWFASVAAAAVEASKQMEFCATITRPRDCGDIQSRGSNVNGVYTVYVGNALRPVRVYCDMATDNGDWTVGMCYTGT